MSGPTAPKDHTAHNPSGGRATPKNYVYIAIGGVVFLAAWLVWNFWYGATIPR